MLCIHYPAEENRSSLPNTCILDSFMKSSLTSLCIASEKNLAHSHVTGFIQQLHIPFLTDALNRGIVNMWIYFCFFSISSFPNVYGYLAFINFSNLIRIENLTLSAFANENFSFWCLIREWFQKLRITIL